MEKWTKRLKRIGIAVAILLFIVIVGMMSMNLFVDYIWMDTIGFAGVFKTVLSSKVILGLSGFVIYGLTTYLTLFWIYRTYMSHFDRVQLHPLLLKRKLVTAVLLLASVVVGLVGSSIAQGIGWERVLKFMNYEQFGVTDPHFNLDISFYMFVLPLLNFAVYLLMGLAVFFLIVEIGAYSVFNMWRLNRSAQLHLGVTLGVIGVLLAATHALAPYETLLTNQVSLFQESAVYGLSYTDDIVNIPKAYVLAGAALLGTIWLIVLLIRGKIQSAIVPIGIYIALVIVGQGASVVVQNFVVSPNEFSKETPYLEENLEYTREAYQLADINEVEHPSESTLNHEMVERNDDTIENIRVNDVRPLLEVYNQLQTIRTYYNFHDVDIDRYEIDGHYEQVFIGARELSMKDLPDQAQTWVNRYLRYTHGYGVAMSHVNEVTPQGQPKYMVDDIPPTGVIDIERPQIYFGEEEYPNVIVKSKVDEFDYPSGGDNKSNRFEADSGIPLKGLNRYLFALNEGSFRMMVSDQITDESELLDTRNIVDRVNRIAPFFEYDEDPYIFVRDDGTLAWMMDAYLTGERYPYAEPYKRGENYIRNSVKVTIDAYTGEVDFYAVDTDEPLMKAYDNMFPELFTKDIPEDVRAHFRYPERLFKIQSAMYGTYHMSNLEVFYNREDFWQFPTEKYFNEDIEMEPYYITMQMPEADEEEFILMMPYTPKKRQNMIAWMGVRNDGEHYGEKFVYRFPKQKNIYGPQQIENRINQDSTISKELNLWSQGGSKVIRGNLLAIPIEDTVFYVEPVYIESSNETSLPEVKQVIMAYDDYIVMEPSFDQALDAILAKADPEGTEDEGESEEAPPEDEDTGEEAGEDEGDAAPPITGAEEQLREFAEQFDAYQKALSEGNWEEAAKIMTELQEKLKEIE
nr:UPF0182 family protein [Lentibacillus sp. JNUCC-1]